MFTSRLGNKSPIVRKWIKNADATLMANGKLPSKVTGNFDAVIVWDIEYFGHRDIDNSVKPLLDYLQRLELIENDKRCFSMMVGWGKAPEGCRVEIRSLEGLVEYA
jgi:Holliday junction resolvase RusA-like endonuclease